MRYYILIKSHCEAPDFEAEVDALNQVEAIKILKTQHGEFLQIWSNTELKQKVFPEWLWLINTIRFHQDNNLSIATQNNLNVVIELLGALVDNKNRDSVNEITVMLRSSRETAIIKLTALKSLIKRELGKRHYRKYGKAKKKS